ncbi:TIGR02587 family membrane protein [Leptolyngbya sp. BC1307]|uniref:TIGR02587 family membrane protein n=1 Tax=Leptolyngbya sp. BC1307 TaxID=2029589 RepID=UPI001F0A4B5C|nr:TIGR02587 family membrane protein [Leptolyngbya sp. BC1307]
MPLNQKSSSLKQLTTVSLNPMWAEELRAILRGTAGSFLFGIPLLYTVEVWAIGSATDSLRLLGVQAVTFVVVLLLTQIEGFRRSLTIQPIETVLESIEALGIGIVCAAIALILLRRITLETPLSEALGKLIFEGVPFSLGVTLARSTLERRPRSRRTLAEPFATETTSFRSILRDTLIDIDATLIGAIVIAFSIAPTEEIAIIASALPDLWLLLVMAASLLVSYIIVFASGFTDRSERAERGLLLTPLTETLVAYVVVLIASALMLIFFQQLSGDDPWQEWLGNIIVLGLPASVGGAAGRILV